MTPPADEGARPSGRLVAAVMLFVLAIGAGGYFLLGSRDGWRVVPGGLTAQPKPADAEGWMALARKYGAAGRYPEAALIWPRVLELRAGDAQAHADAADVIGLAGGGSLQGEPERLLQKALKLDPDNVKALALAGRAAYDRGDTQAAARHWQHALLQVAPKSELARELHGALGVAKAAGAGSAAAMPSPGAASAPAAGSAAAMPSPGAASAPAAAAPSPARVQGQVTLAAALREHVAPDDTVFVFARAADGPKAPLAVLRKKAAELPFAFALDDSMAMNPALRLSGVRQVVVGARISKSGNALPQPGDLQALSAPVAVGASGVILEIGEVLR